MTEKLVDDVEDAPGEPFVIHEIDVDPGAAVQSARKDEVEERRKRSSRSRNRVFVSFACTRTKS